MIFDIKAPLRCLDVSAYIANQQIPILFSPGALCRAYGTLVTRNNLIAASQNVATLCDSVSCKRWQEHGSSNFAFYECLITLIDTAYFEKSVVARTKST